MILMYHRIANATHDPWSLCVRPERFAEQLRWLKKARRVLCMAEFADRHVNGTLPADAVAITFDDGYLDNLEVALPVLAELGLPATLFVMSGAIGMSGGFWWDELADLVLTGPAIDAVVPVAGEELRLRWDRRPAMPGWSAADPPPGPREAAYATLWRLLQRAPDTVRTSVMATLRTLLPLDGRTPARPLDATELVSLAAGGVFTLEGHSVTHPALTTLSDDAVLREVVESSAFARASSNEGSIGFAYPYGDVDERIWRIIASTGISWACTTRCAAVAADTDRLTLPRLAIGNWGLTEFSKRIKAVR